MRSFRSLRRAQTFPGFLRTLRPQRHREKLCRIRRASRRRSLLAAAYKPAPPTAIGETKTTEGGVKYETLKEGTGPELKRGQRSTFHYVGTLATDNTVFDSTAAPRTSR